MERIVSAINDVVWSPALVVLLVGAGLYFSIRTRFVQLRRIGVMTHLLFGKKDKTKERSDEGKANKDDGGIPDDILDMFGDSNEDD